MAQSPPIVFIATHGAKEINENNKELKTFDTGKQEHLYIPSSTDALCCLHGRHNLHVQKTT